MPAKSNEAKVVHSSPGRIRLKLTQQLPKTQLESLIEDLKTAPTVRNVQVVGRSITIEHSSENETFIDHAFKKIFPDLDIWSNRLDEQVAKTVANPKVNKLVPLGVLGFAAYKAIQEEAFLAGESAFAIAYVAFDLYWKFKQENITRKIHEGMSVKEIQK